MSVRYQPAVIEPKWQARWEEEGLYRVERDPSRPKHYALVMFPYTSGDLHIGHWYNFAPADVHARFMRMRGYNVFFPFGFDAFGLPAEEAAIKRGIHPFTWTMNNIEKMRAQAKRIGGMYDWSRELSTCLPEYYRWNQWFFLKFYERGLAYKALAPANWCPHCQTVLANEQVIDGRCERCETPVIRKDLEQWFFKITAYAEELLDFSQIEWPERVEAMQRNWIGRSEGVEFNLPVEGRPDLTIPVFTTRIDTVFGMTYVVLAPEHPLVRELVAPEYAAEVAAYEEQARRQTEIERLSTEKEKTGVFIGRYAINPANGRRVPIWVADYVLASYGTGAIMAVPAHDERDFEFARRFGLPIVEVISPTGQPSGELARAYVEPGIMINSGPFDGLPSEEGKQRLADWFEERGIGRRRVNYRLRDWLISRQRYWGTPIPIIYCPQHGTVPVPEQDLPVLLPEDAEFKPTGESPLKYHQGFYHTTCPVCGGPATRETDTMDTFVDSSWYFLRYTDPHNSEAPFRREAVDTWLPVDQYMGGVEHAVMHLLYSRFFVRVLRDLGMVGFSEPFLRLFNQGIILGPDGRRMSKSRGNVVNPDEYVNTLGADTVRCYLMFIGPWDQGGPWSDQGISGVHRFLNRAWALLTDPAPRGDGSADRELRRLVHQTIKGVTEDIERFRYNTMLAKLMILTNGMAELRERCSAAAWREATEALVLLLAPSAPHLAEEVWREHWGRSQSVHLQAWPSYDPALLVAESVTIVVQVNGKVRAQLEIEAELADDQEQVKQRALALPRIAQEVDGRAVQKAVYVPRKLLNLVVR